MYLHSKVNAALDGARLANTGRQVQEQLLQGRSHTRMFSTAAGTTETLSRAASFQWAHLETSVVGSLLVLLQLAQPPIADMLLCLLLTSGRS